MNCRFLLITKNAETQWSQVVQEAVSSLGTLDICPDADSEQFLGQINYDLIIVDASSIVDFAPLVKRVHRDFASLDIIVATASPTWQRAREAMQVGAADYIRKTMDVNELRDQLQRVLASKLPPSTKD